MDDPTPPAWMRAAACARPEHADVAFFVEKGDPPPTAARKVCAACPVREPCLEYAVVGVIDHGVWGGATPAERQKIRRARLRDA